jgi:hypothetical protein
MRWRTGGPGVIPRLSDTNEAAIVSEDRRGVPTAIDCAWRGDKHPPMHSWNVRSGVWYTGRG